MYYRKLELVVPLFFACLGSLLLSTYFMVRWPAPPPREYVEEFQETAFALVEDSVTPVEIENIHLFALIPLEHRDLIQDLYRDPESRDRATDFFAEICASREIAAVILASADMHDISPALALALAWEESRLNPHAVNDKNRDNSVDRGLFQLNNRSFPRLEIQSFFNLELNAQYGMSHLRHCLNSGGSEIAALAMYNAGTVRVRSTGTPKTTLDYVSRILENRKKIENRFEEQELLFQGQQFIEFAEIIVEAVPEAEERPRFMPLMPLASK